MNKKEKINEGKTTNIEISPCDQGHFGSKYCGLYGQVLLLINYTEKCPSCGAFFQNTKILSGFGGHDLFKKNI